MALPKVCSLCKSPRPLSEFPNDKNSRDGKTSACRDCRNGRRNQRERERKETDPKYAEKMRRKNQEGIRRYDASRREYARLHSKADRVARKRLVAMFPEVFAILLAEESARLGMKPVKMDPARRFRK